MAIAGLELMAAWGASRSPNAFGTSPTPLPKPPNGHGWTALPRRFRPPHILGLRFPGGLPPDIIDRLAASQVFVSDRHGVLRVSPHVYNDAVDVAIFASGLERVSNA